MTNWKKTSKSTTDVRFLFTADVHCNAWAQFSTRLPNGRNSRLEDCLEVFRLAAQVAKISAEEGKPVDRFFVLGDLFDSRTKIDVDVYYATWQAVKSLTEVVDVTLLLGNHDSYAKSGESHSLEPFKSICHVIDEYQVWDETDFKNETFRIAAHPWVDDVQKLKDKLATLSECGLLLIHQGMQEAAIGPYAATGHGKLSVKDLPLDKVKYVFAGDYHKRQFFGPGSRVHYIGSPYQLNFGEAGEEKALTLLDTDTLTIKSIPTTSPRFFKCNSAADYSKRCEAGEIRPGRDFVKIECSEDESTTAQKIADTSHTVTVQVVGTGREALARSDRAVVDSDVLLIQRYAHLRASSYMADRVIAAGFDFLGME